MVKIGTTMTKAVWVVLHELCAFVETRVLLSTMTSNVINIVFCGQKTCNE